MCEIEFFTDSVQDLLIEALGDDFDFYIDQDYWLDSDRIFLAIEKGLSPVEYVDLILTRNC